jgi:hypothetical protein
MAFSACVSQQAEWNVLAAFTGFLQNLQLGISLPPKNNDFAFYAISPF